MFMTMYQLTGAINDSKAPGLESNVNFMNDYFDSKGEPAINEHNFANILYSQHFTAHILTNYIHTQLITLSTTDIMMKLTIVKSSTSQIISHNIYPT